MNNMKTLYIDEDIYKNPFFKAKDEFDSLMLYKSYFSNFARTKELRAVQDLTLVSEEDSRKWWTRSEILQSIACSFGYRTVPTVIERDVLDNKYGVIINYINIENSDEYIKNMPICKKWPEVYATYMESRCKIPGMVLLTLANPWAADKNPLYVCSFLIRRPRSLFGYNARKVFDGRTLKNAIRKFRKLKLYKNNVMLPIYSQYAPHWKEPTEESIEDFNRVMMKYIPSIIFCKN